MRYMLYKTSTGELLPHLRMSSDESFAKLNSQDGLSVIEGHYDHLSQRVDIATGKIVDYQPPQPSPDHEWNADTKRWVVKKDIQAKIDAHVVALMKIVQLEAGQHRPMRELFTAGAASDAGKAALAKLTDIDNQIAALRKDL